MKTVISASLPKDLCAEFLARSNGFPGGKSALVREALRTLFSQVPMSEGQRSEAAALLADADKPVLPPAEPGI